MNVLSMLLLSQQFPSVEAGQGGTSRPTPLEYEYMIRPDVIPTGPSEAEKLYAFASRLLDSGAYDRAVVEFKRFLHYFPHHQLGGNAAYAMAWARFKEGSYDEATAWFRKVYLSVNPEELKARALYMMAESDYRGGDYASAIEGYNLVVNRFGHMPLGHRAAFMAGWGHLKLGRWQDASRHFSSLSSDSPYGAMAKTLAEESLRGPTLGRKSPLLAGALSAYLPGAGQLYVGRRRDALVAFLINQGFIIGAVASIYSGNIFLGATLLAIEAGWYSGNIYSALNGAHKHNRRVRRDFVDALHLKYGLK